MDGKHPMAMLCVQRGQDNAVQADHTCGICSLGVCDKRIQRKNEQDCFNNTNPISRIETEQSGKPRSKNSHPQKLNF